MMPHAAGAQRVLCRPATISRVAAPALEIAAGVPHTRRFAQPRIARAMNAPPVCDRPQARVFFALWPDAALAARLAQLAQNASAALGGKPTRAETIHLTLVFVGEVDEDDLPALIAIGNSVRADAVELVLDRLDSWQHQRLLWAGCRADGGALAALVAQLRAKLAAAGFAVDGARQFTAHVSLVRKLPAAAFPLPQSELRLHPPLRWPGASFVLVRSRPSAVGARYERLAGFALGGG